MDFWGPKSRKIRHLIKETCNTRHFEMIKDVPSIFSNTFPKLLMLILKEKNSVQYSSLASKRNGDLFRNFQLKGNAFKRQLFFQSAVHSDHSL